jgi:outer membrane protein, heavy metal efflux system
MRLRPILAIVRRNATVFLLLLSVDYLSAQSAAPLTLDEAVSEAIAKNLALMAERQNVPIAEARMVEAALRPNPRLSFNSDYMDWLRTNLDNQTAGPPEFSTRFDYTVETGGKRQRRVDLAAAVKSVAELQLRESIRQLILTVQNTFVDLLAAQESQALARENLKVFNEILKVNEAKVKAGELAGVDLARTRVAQQQLENAVRQSELRVRTASNNLQHLLGRPSSSKDFTAAGSLRSDPQPLVYEELRADALRNRPDLLATLKDQDRSVADERLQRANAKPDLTFGVAFQRQYAYTDGKLFGAYVNFALPIYDRNQGEILRAQREGGQTRMRARALESAIAAEVENAYQQYQTAQDLLQRISGQLLKDAREVREITEYSYRRGEASLLEFLDAQRAYNDAVQSYNDARTDYTRSLYLIDAVTGRSVNK